MADAALFFDEAVAERASQAPAEMVTFTFGWVLSVQPEGMNEDRRSMSTTIGTNYKAGSCDWHSQVLLRPIRHGIFIDDMEDNNNSSNAFIVVEATRSMMLPGSGCFFKYTIFGDDEMRYELCKFLLF